MRHPKICMVSFMAMLLSPVLALAQTQPTQPPDSREILKSFRTIYVSSGTWLSKPEMLEGALQKRQEFDLWGLTLVRSNGADTTLTIDHQPGWFYYTYRLTHSASGVVLASGKITAWDGKVACEKIADELVKRIKRVRPVPKQGAERKG